MSAVRARVALLQFFILAAIVSLAAGAQDCDRLGDGVVIRTRLSLCSETYQLADGVRLVAGGGLDCNGAILQGGGYGTAIHADHAPALIRGCTIQDFDTGVWLDNSNSVLQDNTIRRNRIGLRSTESPGADYAKNIIAQNNEDLLLETRVSPVPQPQRTELLLLQGSETPDASVIKSAILEPTRTTIMVTITPKRDYERLLVREKIPKRLAESAAMISSSEPFSITQQDPEIAFHIGKISIRQSTTVNYTINKGVAQQDLAEEPPTTTVEEEPAPVPLDVTPALTRVQKQKAGNWFIGIASVATFVLALFLERKLVKMG
ncbi:hypothetical protein HY642_05285 [Candidatus Woesearchaeota archaeon]|nr:hypothetical protein [Candidatus Woesearchaeota archaeon]